jgi:ABC-2 type transport system ATP-binding protein
LATRIGVLHEGRLVDEFDASELSRRVHRDLEVSTCDDGRAAAVLSGAGMTARRDGGALRLDDDWAVAHPDAVATALVHGGTPPTRLTVVEEGLEDYFLRLVGSPAPVGEAPRDVG